MPHIHIHAPFEAGFDRIRRRFDIPERFPVEVTAEAERSVPTTDDSADLRDVPFIAIDPPGATDLDQAFWAERIATGFRVRYAIADPAVFIRPGGAVDREARSRAVTMYSPDLRTPLHPVTISEDRGSLLPGSDRPAVVWTLDLDEEGKPSGVDFRRALVRVEEAISYREAQTRVDLGSDLRLTLLAQIGQARIEREIERGGVSLALPTQQVSASEGRYVVQFDQILEVERWNAQISLLTGMVAAEIMIDAGVGIVRTLPPPTPEAIALLRRHASALRLDWPSAMTYPAFVRAAEPGSPGGAAFLYQAARTLRGAGYEVLPAGVETPVHGAIAAPYAHVTAPLRRLVDRFANEILLAVVAGTPPPDWAVEALAELPDIMATAHQRQNTLDRAMVDFTEAVVLGPHVGEVFDAEVVDLRNGGEEAVITLDDHAVVAVVAHPGLELGRAVRLRLVASDPETGLITFEPA
ncbi:MAG: RNB domain-containing ribonuclease [Acidimicrobiia bacterium]